MQLAHSYDPDADVLTVEGVRYSGSMLRMLAYCDREALVRVSRQDGVLVVQMAHGQMPACVHGASVVQAGDRRG